MSRYNPTRIDSFLLKEAKCATKKDKLVFFCLKNVYLSLGFLSTIILGKKKKDRLYNEKKISFRAFLYKSIEFLHLDNSFLLIFDMPKYNYKFYSLVTRKIPNFLIEDMYASMTAQEEDIREYFKPEKGDIVVDIGAAFGIYTIIASKRIGANGKVIAIEAHPDSFDMLNRNVKLNKLTNVTCLNYAVYSRKMKVKIYSNYTIMSERVREEKMKDKFVEVNADTLDNLLQQDGISHAEVNWIKIDVEGAELDVLKGAYNTLSNSKDIALLIEVHGQDNYKPLIELLNSYNINVIFEENHEWGDRHVIARR
ncbi:MAG: FkbM family methyltransferase [Nitrososphaeraceae archaeon]|jgi:FkbM family methyltransferase